MSLSIEKQLSRHCPICSEKSGEILTTIAFEPTAGDILPASFDVVACRHCQFCFDDMAASQALFDEHYKPLGKYAQQGTAGSGGADPVDLKRWERVVEFLEPHINKTTTIVDIGCGKGGLLQALKSIGYTQLVGIEPSISCRQHLSCAGIENYDSLDTCIATGKTFDCIVTCQVLEHIFDLRGFLQKMWKLANPNTIVYADVPNAAAYIKNNYGPYYFFDREHINHFTEASLSHLFARVLELQPLSEVKKYSEYTVEGEPSSHGIAILAVHSSLLTPHSSQEELQKIVEYCQSSETHDKQRVPSPTVSGPVFLWGLGYYLRRLLKRGVFSELPIAGIIDRDKGGQGLDFNGIPIESCEVLKQPENSEATVFITAVLYATQIASALEKMDFKGRVIDMTKRE